ncbi:hypothetical protein SNEBB_005920 [Seison nebaliae]|nr:hypothetical protein SNEBB_005920 [Seison nebaliae]
MEKKKGFSFLFIQRCYFLLKLIIRNDIIISLLFLLLLGVGIGKQLIINRIGLLPSKFYGVLTQRNQTEFYSILKETPFLVIGVSGINALNIFSSTFLYIKLREFLVRYSSERYFHNRQFYYLWLMNRKNESITIDQKFTQDIDKWSKSFSEIIEKFIVLPGVLIYYTHKSYETNGFIAPIVIYCTFILSTILNQYFINLMAILVEKQEKLEGEWRGHHQLIREESESICLSGATVLVKNQTNNSFRSLINCLYYYSMNQFLLNFLRNMFDYTGGIISYIMIGITLFLTDKWNDIPSEKLPVLISSYSFYIMYLINQFSSLESLSEQSAILAGCTHRIIDLFQYHHNTNNDNNNNNNNNRLRYENNFIRKHDKLIDYWNEHTNNNVTSLTLFKFDVNYQNQLLIGNINMKFVRGRCLIKGPIGCGKTTFVRHLAGFQYPIIGNSIINSSQSFENISNNSISLNKTSFIILPQRPFLNPSTLYQQLFCVNHYHYGNSLNSCNSDSSVCVNLKRFLKHDKFDEEFYRNSLLQRIIERKEKPLPFIFDNEIEEELIRLKLKVENILHHLGLLTTIHSIINDVNSTEVVDWTQVLSPGQQQLLTIARPLLMNPHLLVMDEATNSLSEDEEKIAYRLLNETDIDIILTIGHRNNLHQFHDTHYEIIDKKLVEIISPSSLTHPHYHDNDEDKN